MKWFNQEKPLTLISLGHSKLTIAKHGLFTNCSDQLKSAQHAQRIRLFRSRLQTVQKIQNEAIKSFANPAK